MFKEIKLTDGKENALHIVTDEHKRAFIHIRDECGDESDHFCLTPERAQILRLLLNEWLDKCFDFEERD